jgi:hypothetical protein
LKELIPLHKDGACEQFIIIEITIKVDLIGRFVPGVVTHVTYPIIERVFGGIFPRNIGSSAGRVVALYVEHRFIRWFVPGW